MQHARTQEGEQDVILRCINEEILASMSRVPGKFLEGLALKLLQVQVEPDKNGFGIDLTDSNIVASLVEGGAAANSDLKKGDILVAVDGGVRRQTIDTASLSKYSPKKRIQNFL